MPYPKIIERIIELPYKGAICRCIYQHQNCVFATVEPFLTLSLRQS